jgi:2-dehydropantoate 2-reductase
VCVQNGLDSEDIARRAVRGRCLVLRAITQFGAIFQSPGLINFTASGHTLLEDSPRSAAIAGILTAAGLEGRVSADIKTEIWRKLIFNCVINPITAITGTEVGGIADPRLDPLKRLVIDECLAVARSEGVDFAIDFLSTIAEVFGASRTIASMRQDLMRGRPTEIDHMNGAVVALGRRAGVECPVNAALTAIIKAMDRCTMTA